MLNKLFSRREDEEKARRAHRLPPGQSLTEKFPVLHVGEIPPFNPETWTFRIWGEVTEPKEWTWAEFNALPRTRIIMDIHCVTRWSKLDTEWEGVSLKTLVAEGIITPTTAAKHVLQHCEGGYTTNTPLDMLLADNALLATHFNGEPLTPEHGYPLRVVIGSFANRSEGASAYFWKGGKWLRGLEFLSTDRKGFWEGYGYHNQADPWTEQRFG